MTHLYNGMDLIEKALTMPSLKWFAEQMPVGFFVYKVDESQQLVYHRKSILFLSVDCE